jgi:hypothetical protein
MRYQFASGRSSLPFEASWLTIEEGQTTASHTLYFALVGENPAGVNLLSPIVGPITIPVASRLRISLPSSVRLGGESWQRYILAASTSNTASSFVQVAALNSVDAQGEPIAMPLTLLLDGDEYFELSETIDAENDLPLLPVEGMLRAITSLEGKIFEYETDSTAVPNGETVLADVDGAWLWKPGSFSAVVTSTTDGGGCDQPLDLLDVTRLRLPTYAMTGDVGRALEFWLYNTDAVSIDAGQRVGLNVELSGIAQFSAFDHLLRVTFGGYAQPSDGTLRTTFDSGEAFANVDLERSFEFGRTDLIAPDDLRTGEAYVLKVRPQFDLIALQTATVAGSVLSIQPFFYAQVGEYSPVGAAMGDWIYPVLDRGWVVPYPGLSALALSREGMVGRRNFPALGSSQIFGLLANQTAQTIVINGNGAIYLRTGAIQSGEVLRAIVSTQSGVSAPCAFSAPTTAAGSLQITLNYPSNGTTAQVRANYPDRIAGLASRAKLNASSVTVYVRSGAEVREFPNLGFVDGASQTFNLPSWASGTIVTLPTVADSFSLFAPVSATAVVSGAGDYPAGVQVAFAFAYDGTTITSLSHDSQLLGCIHTAQSSLARLEQRTQVWAEPVISIVNMRAVPAGDRSPYQSRYLAEKGNPYRFHPESTETDDGDRSIRPSDIAENEAGRWLKDDGSQILFGSTEPSNSIGEPGDYYFLRDPHPQAGLLYFKQLSGWVSVISLKGDKGDPGIFLKGSWNSSDTFVATSVVSAGNSSWFAVQPSTNIDPLFDDGTNWLPLARGLRFRNDWSAIATYAVHDVVRRQGKLYLSLTINNNADPSTDAGSNWQIVFDGIRPAGTYNPIGNYAYNDLVFLDAGSADDGSYLYLNPVASSGNAPPNVAYWQRMARNGTQGATGQSFNPRGTYNPLATYSKLDFVDFNLGTVDDGSYVYINPDPSEGNSPPDPAYWQVNALRGAQGAQGATGAVGNANGLVLTSTVSPPSTGANQIALWNNNGTLMLRLPNNGSSSPVGAGGGGSSGAGLESQVFS